MTTYYRPRRYYGNSTAPLARLYTVISPFGTRIYERKSVDSLLVRIIPFGGQFHGAPSERWVRLLGGGWCTGLSVREVK